MIGTDMGGACRYLHARAGLVLLVLLVAASAAHGQSQNPKNLGLGKLLVASPNLTDPHFVHTVVLLVAYTDQDAAGLVINRGTPMTVAKVFPDAPSAHGRTDTAFYGGPVDPTSVFTLVHLKNVHLNEARPVLGSVYFSTSKSLMDLALNSQQPQASFRVYLGYAGWSHAQLLGEIAAGGWYIFPASAKTIFDSDPATLWQRLMVAVLGEPALDRLNLRSARLRASGAPPAPARPR